MSQSLSTLIDFQHYLKEQGYESVIQSPTEINPNEQLVVPLAIDSEGNSILLRIFWSKELEQTDEDKELPHSLQFFILFPFMAVETALPDLIHYLFNLNGTIDMAHFSLYEAQRLIFYRHTQVCDGTSISPEVLLTIVLSIDFIIEMFLSSLSDVALGKKTLKQVQQDVQDVLHDQELDIDGLQGHES
jgi:hypothetical protein